MSELSRPTTTYWVTRDADHDGTLSHLVTVWDERPHLERLGDGSQRWRDSGDGTGLAYGAFPFRVVAAWGHAMPETVRECIVSGLG